VAPCERLLIRLDCLWIFGKMGENVALVIPGFRGIAEGEGVECGIWIAGADERKPLP